MLHARFHEPDALLQHASIGILGVNLIYGAYTSLVYITPVLGGYLADRYLGQRKAVAFGALLLTIAYRKLSAKMFYDALIQTVETTVLILFLVAASNFFGAVFSRLGTPMLLTEFLLSWDISVTWVLLIIMALIFLLGWPLEWVPIVLIIVPILIPVLIKLDVNLVWFGILVAVNLQTAWLSPPVALSAYFLKGVVPEWDLKDIYLGMMQFMVIQVIGLVLIFVFPQIALWLPTLIYGE